MWKFRDFSVFQILREMNFGACRSSKIAVFASFRGFEFCYLIWQNFSLQNVSKFRASKCVEISVAHFSRLKLFAKNEKNGPISREKRKIREKL